MTSLSGVFRALTAGAAVMLGSTLAAPAVAGELGYVPSLADNTVNLIDVAANKVAGKVPMGFNPVVLAITRDGQKVFSANFETDYVSVMDTDTLQTRRIKIGAFPFAALLSPDGTELYVPMGSYELNFSKLAVIDVATETVKRVFSFPLYHTFPFGIELSPDGKIFYISFTDSTVAAYDTQTGAQLKPYLFTNGLIPAWISLSPDGKALYALNFLTGNTEVIDTVTWQRKANIQGALYSAPITAKTSPDGKKLYIAGADGVTVVDTTTYKVLGKLKTDGVATSVGFTADGQGYVVETGKSYAWPAGIPNPFQALALAGAGAGFQSPGALRRFNPATDTYNAPLIATSPIPGVIVFGPDRRKP